MRVTGTPSADREPVLLSSRHSVQPSRLFGVRPFLGLNDPEYLRVKRMIADGATLSVQEAARLLVSYEEALT